MSPQQAWLHAARPRTLALAIAGIALGLFLAAARSELRWAPAILTLVTAVLLQILSNLANDYGDSLHGADSEARSGPLRAVQSGVISAQQMKQAVMVTAGLAVICGLALVWMAFGAGAIWLVLLFVFLGAAAVWAAIAYTASSNPYGYRGLGDIFVFIFFGLVSVAGTYFLQTQTLPAAILLPATSCGLFAVAVLNVNNIRDMESDRRAGKYSIPVRLGAHRARIYHWLLLAGALTAALAYVLITYRSPWQFLFLLSVPLVIANGVSVWRAHQPSELDPLLKRLSLTTLIFVLTFGVGMVV